MRLFWVMVVFSRLFVHSFTEAASERRLALFSPVELKALALDQLAHRSMPPKQDSIHWARLTETYKKAPSIVLRLVPI
jgi:hypothetical protein